jgi:hypothetical protein
MGAPAGRPLSFLLPRLAIKCSKFAALILPSRLYISSLRFSPLHHQKRPQLMAARAPPSTPPLPLRPYKSGSEASHAHDISAPPLHPHPRLSIQGPIPTAAIAELGLSSLLPEFRSPPASFLLRRVRRGTTIPRHRSFASIRTRNDFSRDLAGATSRLASAPSLSGLLRLMRSSPPSSRRASYSNAPSIFSRSVSQLEFELRR